MLRVQLWQILVWGLLLSVAWTMDGSNKFGMVGFVSMPWSVSIAPFIKALRLTDCKKKLLKNTNQTSLHTFWRKLDSSVNLWPKKVVAAVRWKGAIHINGCPCLSPKQTLNPPIWCCRTMFLLFQTKRGIISTCHNCTLYIPQKSDLIHAIQLGLNFLLHHSMC